MNTSDESLASMGFTLDVFAQGLSVYAFYHRFFRNKSVNICTAGRKETELKTRPRTDTRTSFLVSIIIGILFLPYLTVY